MQNNFEEWFIKQHMFSHEQFDEWFQLIDNKYHAKIDSFDVTSYAFRLNFMHAVWNTRQSEIDQLKAQIIEQGQRFNDLSQKVKDLDHQLTQSDADRKDLKDRNNQAFSIVADIKVAGDEMKKYPRFIKTGEMLFNFMLALEMILKGAKQ